MARIFLSYAHEDQAAAKRIVDALDREGLEAWWDHQIPPGRTWAQMIGERISAAQAIIVVWSARSVESNFVQEEAQMALDAGKLLPVRIDDSQPPVGFRRLHAANLGDWRGDPNHKQWQALINEIRTRSGAAPTRPRPPPAKSSRPRWLIPVAASAAVLVAIGAAYVVGRRALNESAVEYPAAVETIDETATNSTTPEQPSQAESPAPTSTTSRVEQQAAAPVSIVASTWAGTYEIVDCGNALGNSNAFEIVLRDNGQGTAFPLFGTLSWTQDGSSFSATADFEGRLRGTISGDTMTGTFAYTTVRCTYTGRFNATRSR